MPRKQQKSIKGSTEGTQRTSGDRKRKKELSGEGSYQGDLWQKNYLDGWTKDMTKNIGQGWKEIGGDGKEEGKEDEEQWKQLKKKKKRSNKETQR